MLPGGKVSGPGGGAAEYAGRLCPKCFREINIC
jgi:hypothetical protein